MKKSSFKRKKTEKLDLYKQSENFEQYFDNYLIKAVLFKKHLDEEIIQGVLTKEKENVNSLLEIIKSRINKFKHEYFNKNEEKGMEKALEEKLINFENVINVITTQIAIFRYNLSTFRKNTTISAEKRPLIAPPIIPPTTGRREHNACELPHINIRINGINAIIIS